MLAARPGANSDQKLWWLVTSFDDSEKTLLIPPPASMPQISSATLPPTSSGAAVRSSQRMPSMPRRMIPSWTNQKNPNANALWSPTSAQPLHSVVISASIARAAIQVWMPNQPHATSARAIAATLAPRIPKLERTSTGNGIPYFVPGCALSSIGISTITLPSETVSRPCHHVIPAAIRPDASVYVVVTIERPIHSAAKSYVPQVRRLASVGARSPLDSGDSAIDGSEWIVLMKPRLPLGLTPRGRVPNQA